MMLRDVMMRCERRSKRVRLTEEVCPNERGYSIAGKPCHNTSQGFGELIKGDRYPEMERRIGYGLEP